MADVYQETLRFVYGLERYGIKFGLEVMTAVLAALGNPHRRFVTLHIAGTNGKGSSAAMAAEILQAAGYRVGLYTSPHVYDLRERIRVQGEPIPEDGLIELTARLRTVCDTDPPPTFFEWMTALAFLYFAECRIDVAVVEVGMGGRLDATNVLMPLGTLITNVTHDHERFLGTTIPAIAEEKAGIIKPEIPVILGPMSVAAQAVMHRRAAERRAPWYQVGEHVHIRQEAEDRFAYQGIDRTVAHLTCALRGRHQWINAACAMALLEVGAMRGGLRVSEEAIRTGLARVRWAGRLDVWQRAPVILADGAHNPAAAGELAVYLTQLLAERPGSRLFLVVGMMRDKDHVAFLAALAPLAHRLVVTRASLSRAAAPQELAACLPAGFHQVEQCQNPVEALSAAERLAGPSDIICITGSLILIGELGVAMRHRTHATSTCDRAG